MADTKWIEEYAQKKKGALAEYKVEWGALRFLVAGKMFGMLGIHKDGRPILSLKLEPANGEMLRQQYSGTIIPGYYMNKVHWNSVYLDGDVPREVIEKMIDESYRLIFKSLTKKQQAEIENSV